MKAVLSLTLCLVLSSVGSAEVTGGYTVEWLSHESDLAARATPSDVEHVKGPGEVEFTKMRFRLDEVIKGPLSAGDTVTVYDYSYNKRDAFGFAKAKQDKKQLLVFAVVAQHQFKQIDGKYVLTQTREFKSAYCPGSTITRLFTPEFDLVTEFEDLLERTRSQVRREADLRRRYWKGTIVKKRAEVPWNSEAHRHLYSGSGCYLLVPEYRRRAKSSTPTSPAAGSQTTPARPTCP